MNFEKKCYIQNQLYENTPFYIEKISILTTYHRNMHGFTSKDQNLEV